MTQLGTPLQAIQFAVDHEPEEGIHFLRDWCEGDLSGWPDYVEWLQEADNRQPEK